MKFIYILLFTILSLGVNAQIQKKDGFSVTEQGYTPNFAYPFVFDFNGYTLKTDSMDLGVAKIPFAGVSKVFGSYLYGVSVQDAGGIGGKASLSFSTTKLSDFSGYNVTVDSTKIELTVNGAGSSAQYQITLDANGVKYFGLGSYANDAAAGTGGVPSGYLYVNSSTYAITQKQ